MLVGLQYFCLIWKCSLVQFIFFFYQVHYYALEDSWFGLSKFSSRFLSLVSTSSLSFFCSPSSKTWDTQMATRVTDGARRERHEKRETTRKARENGLSRSSDFWASKLKCWQARHVKRDLRVCLNNRGFPTFLFKAQLMQCIELVPILN